MQVERPPGDRRSGQTNVAQLVRHTYSRALVRCLKRALNATIRGENENNVKNKWQLGTFSAFVDNVSQSRLYCRRELIVVTFALAGLAVSICLRNRFGQGRKSTCRGD